MNYMMIVFKSHRSLPFANPTEASKIISNSVHNYLIP